MINVIKQEEPKLPKLKYYLATYKKYMPVETEIIKHVKYNIIPTDEITSKEPLDISEDNTIDDIKNAIAQLVLFNQENKSNILQGSLGNYIIQQKLINE